MKMRTVVKLLIIGALLFGFQRCVSWMNTMEIKYQQRVETQIAEKQGIIVCLDKQPMTDMPIYITGISSASRNDWQKKPIFLRYGNEWCWEESLSEVRNKWIDHEICFRSVPDVAERDTTVRIATLASPNTTIWQAPLFGQHVPTLTLYIEDSSTARYVNLAPTDYTGPKPEKSASPASHPAS